jgi:hypothetical protein
MSDQQIDQQPSAVPALDATEVARRLNTITELSRHLTQRDLTLADGAVQDALAALAFNRSFIRLIRRVAAIRRAVQRYTD